MRNFNQGGFGRFSGNRGSGRPNDRGPVTMHRAVCSACGKDCEVPFRPTGDKPIYCNDCFGANRDRGDSMSAPRGAFPRGGDRGGDRFPRKEFNRGNNDEVKKQLEFLGLKIDRLTKVVESLVAVKSSPTKEKTAEVKKVLKDISTEKKVAKKKTAK